MLRSVAIKASVFIFSLVVCLVLAEIFVRVSGLWVHMEDLHERIKYKASRNKFYPYTYQPYFELKEQGIHLKANSLGFKTKWEPNQVKENCFRILALGGSITAGFGLSNEEAYPQQMEKLLNENSQNCFQVVNAGQIAFSMKNILGVAEYLVPLYRPNLILFPVNKFALDDDKAVDEEQNLIPGSAKLFYYNHLRMAWRVEGKYFDYSQPYKVPPSPNYESEWYSKFHSVNYFLPYFEKLMKRVFSSAKNSCEKDCMDLSPTFKNHLGQTERLPEYSALYMSLSARKNLYFNMERAILLANKEKTPLVFIGMEFYVDPDKISKSENVRLTNISEIIGGTEKDLFEKQNLVWDFHLSSAGSEAVAWGMMKYLSREGLIPFPAEGANDRRFFSEYVAAQRQQEKVFLSQFDSYVDVLGRKNLHQIIGGFNPEAPRVLNKAAVMLNKSGQKKVIIHGGNFAPVSMNLVVQLTGENFIESVALEVRPGAFETYFEINDTPDGALEVYLECDQESCPVQVNWIGLQ